jgi:hypothetical protein
MSTNPNSWIVVGVALVLAAFVAGLLLYARRKRQSARLERRFGPEYAKTVDDLGGRSKGESELMAREERVDQLEITPLTPTEAARFSQAWASLQGGFVDNPKGVVVQADQLVSELMVKRGFPMGDFERRAADISVDHPSLVTSYRAAQVIAERNKRGEADTEQLRTAVVHYRSLFDELLEVSKSAPELLLAKPLAANA